MLTIYTTWQGPGVALPPMFCLCRWLLDLEALPYEEQYAPERVVALTQGKCRVGQDFLIVSQDGACVVRDIYGLAKWIEARGLKRV